MKMLWIDGESLTDSSFSHFGKMVSLELLSVSFADNIGETGITAIASLNKLGKTHLQDAMKKTE